MRQSKTLIYWLACLLVLSLSLFLILRECYNDSNALVIIFRTFFTGSVVGLISAIITYYYSKARVLQDFSNDLLKTHTELFNVKKVLEDAAERIEHRGLFYDTQELSIWTQTINSIASAAHNSLLVPYKFSPLRNSFKNHKIVDLMHHYVKADRLFWDDIERARFQIMTAKMAMDDTRKLRSNPEMPDPETEKAIEERILRNNYQIDQFLTFLRNAARSGDQLVNLSLNSNAFLDANTMVSPLLEIEESEREKYAHLVEKAKADIKPLSAEWRKKRKKAQEKK